MMSEKMIEAMNGQANRELYSSYLYISMSAYFESINMKGMARWMRVQAGEELVHAMKMYDYIISTGSRAKMLPIEAPQFSWNSSLEAFQHVWNHERAVTRLIHSLMDVAASQNDEMTMGFLQWYVDEQVEEEESSDNVLNKIKAAGNDKDTLQTVDKELGQRNFKFPRGYSIFPSGAQFNATTIGSLRKE